MVYITYSSLIFFQISTKDSLSQSLEFQAERQLVRELLSNQESVIAYVRRKLRAQDAVLNNQRLFLNFQQRKFKLAQMLQNTHLFRLSEKLDRLKKKLRAMMAAP
jgi:hypothetical protein